jgi:hypothetical protein
MKSYILPFMLLCGVSLSSQGQVMSYDLMNDDDVIGSFKVSKYQSGTLERYHSVAEIKVSLVWTLRMGSTYKAVFKDGNLLTSSTTNHRNDDLTGWAKGYREGSTYINIVDGDTSKTPMPIDYVALSLYFEEPVGRTQAYDERRGVFLPIQNLGNHHYQLTTYDGRHINYTFVNGVCTAVELEHWLGNIDFRLKTD